MLKQGTSRGMSWSAWKFWRCYKNGLKFFFLVLPKCWLKTEWTRCCWKILFMRYLGIPKHKKHFFSETLGSSNGMNPLCNHFNFETKKTSSNSANFANFKVSHADMHPRKLMASTWKRNYPWNSGDSEIGNHSFEGPAVSFLEVFHAKDYSNNPTGPANVAVVASSWNAIPSLLAEAPEKKVSNILAL